MVTKLKDTKSDYRISHDYYNERVHVDLKGLLCDYIILNNQEQNFRFI